MKIVQNTKFPQLFLRVAIGSAYLWEFTDRLGILGAHGQPHVGWGDWGHFIAYARQVMAFLPPGIVPVLAVIATVGEGLFGTLILIGLFTRTAAIGSGILSFCFALAMSVSFGIESPLGYSVFTLSAANFLLATLPTYEWSVDNWLTKKNSGRISSGAIIFAGVIGLMGFYSPARAQQVHQTSPRKITEQYLIKQFINEHGISDREVQIEVVNFPPGSSSPAHRHPCPTFGYVLDGELESVFEGKRHLFKKGDCFYESTNGLHAVTRNNDRVKTARLLVFFIAEKNKPTTIR
ncbi:cupin domain-containing protein [Mucilaginibacter ginsenosidivorans]|uniref:Cupin domain-containing protein n=1 Tax=Mucilaginibacter ginsenosidivorans TaxID=398053 RepID=A0A5B8UV06_9SPHI|nr:cupin domain-containing protein [Mucilaginibacter ginsenosidivorans]QEC62957.1 cupin domain-containing protein [Mucilaginibacter ginsenosidivorans]